MTHYNKVPKSGDNTSVTDKPPEDVFQFNLNKILKNYLKSIKMMTERYLIFKFRCQ